MPLMIPADYPLPPSFGKKLLASVEHLMDPTIDHNRDVDANALRAWLVAHEPSLDEYKAKGLPAYIVEPLENAARLARAGIACA